MGQIDVTSGTAQARKHVLRRQMRAIRAALSVEQRAEASILIGARLSQLLTAWKIAKDDALAVFLAKGDEVGLDVTIASLLERGQCLVAPIRVGVAEAPFYTLSRITGGTRIGAWRVREPLQIPNGRAYWPHELKAIVVPGLAFDRQGGRLGYGGGWYDRVLGEVPVSIGVCYDCQLIAQVPCEAHDQRVAFVVTETQTLEMMPQRMNSRQGG